MSAADRVDVMRDLMRSEQLAEFFRHHHTRESVEGIVRAHTPDGRDRCPECHSMTAGGCFLWRAATAALEKRR